MATTKEFSVSYEAKDFIDAFWNSIKELNQTILNEVCTLVDADDVNSEIERIRSIHNDILVKSIYKHEKSGRDFWNDNGYEDTFKKLPKGVTLRELLLSQMLFAIDRAAFNLASGDLNTAHESLNVAHIIYGKYRSYSDLIKHFNDPPVRKINKESFRRDTLLKIVYGMANYSYHSTPDNIKNCSNRISTALLNHSIMVDSDEISVFLIEAYKLEKSEWKHNRTNSGTVTDSERIALLKLILGMAIDKHDYDLKRATNIATGDGKCGISTRISRYIYVSNGTIHDCLTAAREILIQ